MTSMSLGSTPAWAMASLAALTISDSLVSPSSLPNLPWDHPTMQAVMDFSFGLGARAAAGSLDGTRLRVEPCELSAYTLMRRRASYKPSKPPKFRPVGSVDWGVHPEPYCI